MTNQEYDETLAACLEDFHRRKALGETPLPGDYEARAGEAYPDLQALLRVEAEIDAAIEPAAIFVSFPRTFGNYTLLRELGRGAMGVVYEAVHRTLGRTVALKTLRTGLDTDEVALERFRREARACAQVHHENVVHIHDAGMVDGIPYYSMTILEGKTLDRLAKEGGLPPFEELSRAMVGVADALETLHRAGIVHRDVKPSNLILEPGGKLVLADFGLARTAAAAKLTQTGAALGTPLYMSPEQLFGRSLEIDGRADVYALGSTLYDLVTGSPMFTGEDASEVMRRIMRERPASPRERNPEVPKALERIIMKAVEKRKEDRYQSAAEMRDDLRRFADGEEPVARPVSDLRHRVRRVLPFLPAAAALLLFLGIGAWFWTNQDATLIVSCVPDAIVAVDGEDRGTTTLSLRLRPGEHVLSLRGEGFEEIQTKVYLGAGKEVLLPLAMPVRDPLDLEAQARAAQSLSVVLDKVGAASRNRGDPPAVYMAPRYPRGRVRAEDLTEWRMDVGPDFEGPAQVEFRRGEELLASVPFDPVHDVNVAPIPAALREAVAPGDRVQWGVYRDGRAVATAEFTMADAGLQARLDRIDEDLKVQPPLFVHCVRARILLAEGYAMAALAEARKVTAEAKDSPVAWRIQMKALAACGLEGAKGEWFDAFDAYLAAGGE